MQKVLASSTLRGVNSDGEPDGDHSNQSDDGGRALALVWVCIQAEL